MRTKRKNRSPRWQRHGPKFIQLFRYLLDSPAYMSLSVWARAALIEVNRGYNGSNNGRAYLRANSRPLQYRAPESNRRDRSALAGRAGAVAAARGPAPR